MESRDGGSGSEPEDDGGASPSSPARVDPATTSDLDALAHCWVELAASQRPHGSHLLAAANRVAARELLAQLVAAGSVFVARGDAGVLGFVSVHLETGTYEQDAIRGVVDNVYVRHGSRNEGIGTLLLDVAEAHLEERGADVLAVSALATNDGARRLYESRGYEPHRVTYERPADGSDTHSREADR